MQLLFVYNNYESIKKLNKLNSRNKVGSHFTIITGNIVHNYYCNVNWTLYWYYYCGVFVNIHINQLANISLSHLRTLS